MKKNKPVHFPPLIFNVFKPARMTSYDVLRHFKRHLPLGFGKIGHFGTLDPFASGVMLIGIAGAARLNDYIHAELPKTYLAIGKLGVETPTGDLTVAPTQIDQSDYLKNEISRLPKDFLQQHLNQKFLGSYAQAPHQYSAAKFMGKPLHEWARSGVLIKKDEVQREIFEIQVVKYNFPYLSIRYTVSSGTYIRTLFSDMAKELGTLGTLVSLVREGIGSLSYQDALKKKDWPHNQSMDFIKKGIPPENVLPYPILQIDQDQERVFRNGGFLTQADSSQEGLCWIKDSEGVRGLAFSDQGLWKPKFIFPVYNDV